MIITRETDYALRILRALMDGQLHTVGELAQGELLPQPFAYKIIKKLCKAGLVQITRGAAGGCRLSADLSQVTLYDLLLALGEPSAIAACMEPATPALGGSARGTASPTGSWRPSSIPWTGSSSPTPCRRS